LKKTPKTWIIRKLKSTPAFLKFILGGITEGAFTIKKELVFALKALEGLIKITEEERRVS